MPESDRKTREGEIRIVRVVFTCGCELTACDCETLMEQLVIETRDDLVSPWVSRVETSIFLVSFHDQHSLVPCSQETVPCITTPTRLPPLDASTTLRLSSLSISDEIEEPTPPTFLEYAFKPSFADTPLQRHVRVILSEDAPTPWKITEFAVDGIPGAYA